MEQPSNEQPSFLAFLALSTTVPAQKSLHARPRTRIFHRTSRTRTYTWIQSLKATKGASLAGRLVQMEVGGAGGSNGSSKAGREEPVQLGNKCIIYNDVMIHVAMTRDFQLHAHTGETTLNRAPRESE